MGNLELLSLEDQREINGGVIPPTSNSYFALTSILVHAAVDFAYGAIERFNKYR